MSSAQLPLHPAQTTFISATANDPQLAFSLAHHEHIRGRLDVAALVQAISLVQERHEALRLRFHRAGRCFAQSVAGDVAALDLLQLATPGSSHSLERHAAHLADLDASTPWEWDLAPIRARLLRRTQDEFAVLLTVNRAAVDAVSLRLLVADLWNLYGAIRARQAATERGFPRFSDVVRRQRSQLDRPGTRHYWQTVLLGARFYPAIAAPPENENLPSSALLGTEMVLRLRRAVQTLGAPMGTVLLWQWALALFDTTEQGDVTFGVPVSSRSARDGSVIGCFARTLPLRLRRPESGEISLVDVHRAMLALNIHQGVQENDLSEAMKGAAEPAPRRWPIVFDVRDVGGAPSGPSLPGLVRSPFQVFQPLGPGVCFTARVHGDGLTLDVRGNSYKRERCGRLILQRFARRLLELGA